MADDPGMGDNVDRSLRATAGWNRLNRALTIGLRKNLTRTAKARRRIKGRR